MNRSFYELDGSPIPGKAPVQVHVYGDGDHEAALNEAEGEIAVFLDAVRLSPATQHRREAQLESGGSVRMSAVQDVIVVEVLTVKRTVGGEGFYGGILLKLNVVRNESQFREDCMKDAPEGSALNRHDLKLPISHSKFSGENETLPGRPAVPGTTDEDLAEWIVLQIAKDKPLGADPFNTGAVKIFRIKTPQFGAAVEFGLGATFPTTTSAESTEDRYLLSATPAIDALGKYGLADFCLCGQRVEGLPSFGTLPLGSLGPTDYAASNFSIYAVDFIPDSFETAYAAGGIVIVAAGDTLAAINTAEKTPTSPATWKILDVVARGNDFGATFTDTIGFGGVRTITCHGGSNGLGGRSGYSVTITPNPSPNGFPTISGSLSTGVIEPEFTVVPGIETYSKSMSGSATGGLITDVLPPLDTQFAYGYAGNTFTMSCSSVWRPPEFIPRKDKYTGEVPPRETVETVTFTASNYNNSMTTDSNFMSVDASSIDYTWAYSSFVAPSVPAAETLASLKSRRIVGPMYSAKVRTNWLDMTSSPTAGSGGTESTARFYVTGDWKWGELVESYRIIRADGSTVYDWGELKLKFPSAAQLMWGPLEQPLAAGYYSRLPIEPQKSPRIVDEISGAPVLETSPPEYLGSAFRFHAGGYPELGVYGNWTFPPIPYYAPGGAIPYWMMASECPASWAFTAAFNPANRPPNGTYVSASGMAGMFPSSRYRDGIVQRAWASGMDYPVTSTLQYAHPVAVTDTVLLGAVQGPYRGGMYGANSNGRPTAWMGASSVNDWYIRDPRTGGFVAQMYWATEVPDDPEEWSSLGYPWIPRTFPTTCEIIVGNDLGTVPLAALLNEWMHLGEVSAPGIPSLPTTYNLVFIDDRAARQAMLI